LEDADFSLASIKELIRQGEEDAEDAIANNNQETLKIHNKVKGSPR
jgi:hypothetical protein